MKVPCPRCKGQPNGCLQCDYLRFVEVGSRDQTCMHDFQYVKKLADCLRLFKCSVCGTTRELDSSD